MLSDFGTTSGPRPNPEAPKRIIEVRCAKKGRVTGWIVRCSDTCQAKAMYRTQKLAVAMAQEHDKTVHKGGGLVKILANG